MYKKALKAAALASVIGIGFSSAPAAAAPTIVCVTSGCTFGNNDPTVGSGTSIAVGKYIGRRVFVELVTDGAGYNATSVEFRITRWLALLGTMSTIGDESLNLKVSKDY